MNNNENNNLTTEEWIEKFQLSGALLNSGSYDLAIVLLNTCITYCPDDMNQNLSSVYNNLGFCFENKDDEVGAVIYGSDAYNAYKKASDFGHTRAPDIVWRCAFNHGKHSEGIHYMKIHAEFGDCEAIQSLATITSIDGFENLISTNETIYFTEKLINCGFAQEIVEEQIKLLRIKQLAEENPDFLKKMIEEIQDEGKD